MRRQSFLAVPRSVVVTMVAPEATAGVLEGMRDDMGPDAEAVTAQVINSPTVDGVEQGTNFTERGNTSRPTSYSKANLPAY